MRDQNAIGTETVIYELIIEKFSMDPADYDTRTTLTKLCFIRLPNTELLYQDHLNSGDAF